MFISVPNIRWPCNVCATPSPRPANADTWATNVLGHGLDFDIQVKLGAGAFVCGEETALIASLEDQIGEPKPEAAFPVNKGLWGLPTCINNVETWATVPKIVRQRRRLVCCHRHGEVEGHKDLFAGRQDHNTGLVEVPMGIPLREIIYGIGGGIPEGQKIQSRADRRSIGRLHSGRAHRCAGGLREPHCGWVHHGLRRHGGHG